MSKLTPSRRPGCRTIERALPRAVVMRLCVVSLTRVRRSPRPRPGRTSRSRRSGSGCGAGGPPARGAGVAGVPGRALQSPASLPGRVPAAEERGSASCGRGPAGVRARLADEPEVGRPHSTVHQVLQRGGCSRRPRPERPAGHPLSVAVPRPAAAHGHQALRPLRAARPRAHRRPHGPLAARRLGVRALDRR